MNDIDLYRNLAREFRLPVKQEGRGFKADGGDFQMRASNMTSEACCLSYWDSSVAMDIEIYRGAASFMYTVMKGYLAPVRSHLSKCKNPLAKRVLANFHTDFTKLPGNEQYAALSRVDVVSIDSAVALIRDQVKFRETICTR